MIREIAGRKIDLTNEEFGYYQQLEKDFGKEQFRGLFETDEAGRIILVAPRTSHPTSMILIFYFMNVMLNQRLRAIDYKLSSLNELSERVKKLERMVKDGKST